MTFRRFGVYSAAVLIAAWVLLPLVLIALATFTPRDVLYDWPRPIVPRQLTTETLLFFVRSAGVLQSTWNSVLVAGMTIALAFAISAPTGYALARYRFRGRETINLAILATKM
ncbi:MAG: carbohydrate ABC transporter permease, partial [Armatimonadota bacterium]|nr:carbohydrate ABC transporter permease [Armatimonadota bacterium]